MRALSHLAPTRQEFVGVVDGRGILVLEPEAATKLSSCDSMGGDAVNGGVVVQLVLEGKRDQLDLSAQIGISICFQQQRDEQVMARSADSQLVGQVGIGLDAPGNVWLSDGKH